MLHFDAQFVDAGGDEDAGGEDVPAAAGRSGGDEEEDDGDLLSSVLYSHQHLKQHLNQQQWTLIAVA